MEAPAVKNLDMRRSPSENLYENVMIVAKRARKIATNYMESMLSMLEELGPGYEDDFSYDETRIALISKFEKMEKPVLVAKRECESGLLFYGYPPAAGE